MKSSKKPTIVETIDCSYLNLEDLEERFKINEELIEYLAGIIYEDSSKEVRNSLYQVIMDGEAPFTIRLNDLLFSLMLFPSRFNVHFEFGSDYFLHDIKEPDKAIKEFMDDTIEFATDEEFLEEIQEKIGYCLERICKVAWMLNLKKGNSVNLIDILKLAGKNKEVYDILNFTSDENAQFNEIGNAVKAKNERLIEILRSDDTDTCLKNMLSCVSKAQFQQLFVNISLKPDLYGKVIEKPINTSFLRGLRDSTDMFINAVGARKALCVNASTVKTAGYLSRKLALHLLTIDLDKSVKFCGSKDHIEVDIDSAVKAERFYKRFYKLNPTDKKYKLVGRDVSDLIGKKIYVSSPITCSLAQYDKVCMHCYGKKAASMKFHVGVTASIILSDPMLQQLLSSKHLLQVITKLIKLSKVLQEYFEVDKNDIVCIKPCKVQIVETTEDEFSGDLLITRLGIAPIGDSDEEETNYSIVDIDDLDITLNPNMIEMLDTSSMEITFKEADNAFRMEIQNNELSAPLKKFLKIIESGKELNARASISEVLKDLNNLLIESQIYRSSLIPEMIIRELARDINDLHEKSTEVGKFQFIRLTSAIMNSGSASVALSFEQHTKLLEGPLFKKHKSSPLDYIF